MGENKFEPGSELKTVQARLTRSRQPVAKGAKSLVPAAVRAPAAASQREELRLPP